MPGAQRPGWLNHTWLTHNQNGMRLGILLIYIALTATTMHAHTMWRDETQAWLVARDSPNIATLLQHLRYEGHPALWYLLLMPLTRLTRNPVSMQCLNLAIAAVTVAVVVWRAPLSRVERALFPFGYFMLYEYGVKSRSYALGFLLLVTFCALWPKRRQYPVLIAVILALLANVHLLLLVLSISAAAVLILDRRTAPGSIAQLPGAGWRPYLPGAGWRLYLAGAGWRPYLTGAGWRPGLIAACLLLAGWVIAVLTIRPPPDPGFVPNWYFAIRHDRIHKTFNAISTMVSPHPSRWSTDAAIVLLLIIALRWKAAPQAALFFLLSMTGMLTLFYVKLPGSTWLHGVVFMAFFATVWLARTEAQTKASIFAPGTTPPGTTPKHLIPPFIFCIVLAIQVPFGLAAVKTDLHHPLSNGRAVARYLRAQGWANEPIIGLSDTIMSPIIGYLGIDRIYYANGQRWGSFTILDRQHNEPIDIGKVLQTAAAMGPREILIAGPLTQPDPKVLRQYGFTQVARFTGAREKAENYTLYRRAVDQ